MNLVDIEALLGQAEHICSEEKYNFLKHWCNKQTIILNIKEEELLKIMEKQKRKVLFLLKM